MNPTSRGLFPVALVFAVLAGQLSSSCSPSGKSKGNDDKNSHEAPLTRTGDALVLGGGFAQDKGVLTVLGEKKAFDFGFQTLDVDKEILYGTGRKLDWKVTESITKFPVNPASHERIILQAFNMPYGALEKELEGIKKAGYTTVQISPPAKSLENYGIWWELYQPVDLTNLNNRLGSKLQLRSFIAKAHALGIEVIADVVLNHMADPSRVSPKTEEALYYPISDKPGEFLFEPKHFHYPDVYLIYRQFHDFVRRAVIAEKVQIRDAASGKPTKEFVDLLKSKEFEFYYSEQSSFFRDFLADVKANNIFGADVDHVPQSWQSEPFYAAEIAFLRKRLPTVYAYFKSVLGSPRTASKGGWTPVSWDEKIFENKNAYEAFAQSAQFADFKKGRDYFFGTGPMVAHEFYWSIQAGNDAPLFHNEWDDLNDVWHKWYPGLPSLRKGRDVTEEDKHVLEVHADYLKSLIELGIDGFRVDAVKHLPYNYMPGVLARVQEKMKDNKDSVDGVALSQKNYYYYGEVATSHLEVSNIYRKYLEVTDFFLLDTLINRLCIEDNEHAKCKKGENDLRKLRKSQFEAREKNTQEGWVEHITPRAEGAKASTFRFSEPISLKNPQEMGDDEFRSTISFARIHDSVVGIMYRIHDYTQALLTHAYVMAAAPGTVLVYGSDYDLERNAGSDYKEPIVVAGAHFRHAMSGQPYTDQFAPNQFCAECDSPDLIFIDRGNQGVAIINKAANDLTLTGFHFPNLIPGCYEELLSGSRFSVGPNGVPLSEGGGGMATIRLPKRTAAFVIPCRK